MKTEIRKKILITGLGGLLAPYLVEAGSEIGEVVTTGRKSGDFQCNLANSDEVNKLLKQTKPDWVIHAAGMTDVDGCEENPNKADESNHITAKNIAQNLDLNSRVAFISTDQVYPDHQGPHKESSVDPVNIYGSTKYAGEQSILQHTHGISIRTNLFGASLTDGRKSFDEFVIDNLKLKKTITLFTDTFFSPLHMATLSNKVFEIIKSGYIGAINLGSRNGMSKAEFGIKVADHIGISTDTVIFNTSDTMIGRAPRAHDLRLDTTLVEQVLGYRMPTLQQEIDKL